VRIKKERKKHAASRKRLLLLAVYCVKVPIETLLVFIIII
jgi:hypothetical protein